jgi:hypothetical protein
MNGRSIFLLLALSLSTTLAACGGDDPAPQKSSTLQVNGTYRPTEAGTNGSIGSITFSNNKDYLLVPAGCTSGSCFDIGTYRFDAQTNTITLVNGTDHRERTITLEEMKTSEAAAVLVKTFIGTRDLIEPGEQLVRPGQQTTNGQGQVTGDQSQLNNGQSELAKQVGELIKTIIEAIMNGQKMKQDERDKKDEEKKAEEEKKKEECKQGVPTENSTQAEKDAYAARCPNGP